jgi:hypothetical protein
MNKFIIIVFGVVINILTYSFFQITKRELDLVVPKMYLFFILPLFVFVSIVLLIIYDYSKKKSKEILILKGLVGFFLLIIVLQYLLFSNKVLVK